MGACGAEGVGRARRWPRGVQMRMRGAVAAGDRGAGERGAGRRGPRGAVRTWEQVGDAQRDQRGCRLLLRLLEQHRGHDGGAVHRLLRGSRASSSSTARAQAPQQPPCHAAASTCRRRAAWAAGGGPCPHKQGGGMRPGTGTSPPARRCNPAQPCPGPPPQSGGAHRQHPLAAPTGSQHPPQRCTCWARCACAAARRTAPARGSWLRVGGSADGAGAVRGSAAAGGRGASLAPNGGGGSRHARGEV